MRAMYTQPPMKSPRTIRTTTDTPAIAPGVIWILCVVGVKEGWIGEVEGLVSELGLLECVVEELTVLDVSLSSVVDGADVVGTGVTSSHRA